MWAAWTPVRAVVLATESQDEGTETQNDHVVCGRFPGGDIVIGDQGVFLGHL